MQNICWKKRHSNLRWVKKYSFTLRPTAGCWQGLKSFLMASTIFSNELVVLVDQKFTFGLYARWWQNVEFSTIQTKLNARMQSNFSGCFHAGECTVAVKLSGKSSNIFFFTSFRKSSRTCISVFWSCEGKRKRFNLPLYCLVSSCRKKVLQEDGISLTSVSTYFHDFRVDIEYLSWESFWRRIVKKTSTYNVFDWRWRHESRSTKTKTV